MRVRTRNTTREAHTSSATHADIDRFSDRACLAGFQRELMRDTLRTIRLGALHNDTGLDMTRWIDQHHLRCVISGRDEDIHIMTPGFGRHTHIIAAYLMLNAGAHE